MAATSHIGFQSPVEDSCPTDGLGIVAMMLLAITFQSPVEDSCPTDMPATAPEEAAPAGFSPLSRIHAPLTT